MGASGKHGAAFRDHIRIGAFNLIRRQADAVIGGHENLRLEVADDLKLGEAVKKAGLRQDIVLGPNLVCLRWAVGAAGVIRNLEKNLFAYMGFRLSLVLPVCLAKFFFCVWPFLGLMLAPGWARMGFVFAVAMIAAAYFVVSRHMAVSPWLFLACPISAMLFIFAGALRFRGPKRPGSDLARDEISARGVAKKEMMRSE